jgi:hypothetical protein
MMECYDPLESPLISPAPGSPILRLPVGVAIASVGNCGPVLLSGRLSPATPPPWRR